MRRTLPRPTDAPRNVPYLSPSIEGGASPDQAFCRRGSEIAEYDYLVGLGGWGGEREGRMMEGAARCHIIESL